MLASVDTIFSVIDNSFAYDAEIHFRQFIKRSSAINWMIGADFVVDEPSAAHDAFAFTIFPYHTYHTDFRSTLREIDSVLPKDIKGTKIITEDMLIYLRDPKRFHFCFLAPKNRHGRDSVQQARATIDRAITTIKGWETRGVAGGEQSRTGYLRTFQRLRQEANASRCICSTRRKDRLPV